MELIKLELNNKTYKIRKPSSFRDFKAKISSKFGEQKIHNKTIFYRDQDGEEIIVENEQDLLVAFHESSRVERFVVEDRARVGPLDPEILKVNQLSSILDDFGSSFDFSNSKKVESFICDRENLKVCRNCFKKGLLLAQKDAPLQTKNCKCAKRSTNPVNLWKLIILMIDCRVKEMLLGPVKQLINEPAAAKSILDSPEKDHDSTRFSYKTEMNRTSLFSAHHHDFLNQSCFANDKRIAKGDLVEPFDAKKRLSKQNTFCSTKKAHFEIARTESECSLPNPRRFAPDKHEFASAKKNPAKEIERFFIKEELIFKLVESEAYFTNNNNNVIEVKLLIENQQSKRWPEGVRLRGRDSELAKDVDVFLPKRLKSQSTLGLTFSFPVKQELFLLSRKMDEKLCFEFFAVDLEKSVKYFSKSFKIGLGGSKGEKKPFGLCGTFR